MLEGRSLRKAENHGSNPVPAGWETGSGRLDHAGRRALNSELQLLAGASREPVGWVLSGRLILSSLKSSAFFPKVGSSF